MLAPLTPDRQALAEAYLPLAQSRVRPWVARWPWIRSDLHGAAALALVEAAASFDFDLGYSFATYARHRIDGSLADFAQGERPRGYRRSADRLPRITSITGRSRFFYMVAPLALDPIDPGSDRRQRAIDDADETAVALRRLPARNAQVCRLVFLDGLTQAETARQLGRSQPLVSDLIGKSAAMLAHAYEPHKATA